MQNYLGIAVAALTLATAGPALAGTYYLAAVSDGQVAFVQLSSVTRNDKMATAEIVRIYQDVQDMTGTDGYQYIVYRSEYDCQARRTRVLSAQAFARDHAVVHTLGDSRDPWRDVEPKTNAANLLDAVCDPSGRNTKFIIELDQTELVARVMENGFQ